MYMYFAYGSASQFLCSKGPVFSIPYFLFHSRSMFRIIQKSHTQISLQCQLAEQVHTCLLSLYVFTKMWVGSKLQIGTGLLPCAIFLFTVKTFYFNVVIYFLLQFLDFLAEEVSLRFICKNSILSLFHLSLQFMWIFFKFYYILPFLSGFFNGVGQGSSAIFFQMCCHIIFVIVEDMVWLTQQSLPLLLVCLLISIDCKAKILHSQTSCTMAPYAMCLPPSRHSQASLGAERAA